MIIVNIDTVYIKAEDRAYVRLPTCLLSRGRCERNTFDRLGHSVTLQRSRVAHRLREAHRQACRTKACAEAREAVVGTLHSSKICMGMYEQDAILGYIRES